ncbi:MAG: OmpH family outer membrane protein [Prevotellaceae bacterium]|jgi:outer membrane protein|nr:OmpH family outer membrane protein [Prevotellaceae bacterium]
MNKKIIIALMLCALPAFAMAQQKIGHVNSTEIMQAMPERATIEKTLEDLQKQWEGDLLKMREEYGKKVADYQKNEASMTQAMKEAKQSELADMEQRMNTLVQTATADIQKNQQELMQPVVEKVKKAIEQVGADNGYTYIIDESTQVLVFVAPNANDITAQVKQKLSIK